MKKTDFFFGPCSLLLVHPNTQERNKPLLFSLSPRLVAAVRVSPCHSRQPSIISDASALEGDRSSTPSDINSPRHRTHSLCNVRAAHHRTLPSSRHTVVTVDLPFAARLLSFPSTIVLAESMSSPPHHHHAVCCALTRSSDLNLCESQLWLFE